MKKNSAKKLTFGALIASSYVILTILSNFLGLASGPIQFRLSEALTVFAFLDFYAVGGLGVGCLLSNILIGSSLWDIVFGSIATFIGALGTYYISRINKKLLWLPPVVSNTLIIPLILRYVYEIPKSYFYFVLTVGVGEIAMCLVCGMSIYRLTKDRIKYIGGK